MNLSIIKQKIDAKYNASTIKWARQRFCHYDICSNAYTKKPLTGEQKRAIKEFWRPYCHLSSDAWKWFEFYNSITEQPDKLHYYIPENIYYTRIDPYYSNVKDCDAFDDKNLYDLLFHDVAQPATVCRKLGNIFLDADYRLISYEQAIKAIREAGFSIIKPSRDSNSGSGITFVNDTTDEADIQEGLKAPSLVVQAILRQHEVLSGLHPQSINTIRIMTLLRNGKVTPVSSVVRIGTGEARVDNAHSGGVVCGIMGQGRLKSLARNLIGTRKITTTASGLPLSSIQIPAYDACVAAACRLAPRLAEFSHLVSWDFSVNEDNEPVMIEANLTYGGIDVHQLCNGPLFGDNTAAILDEVYGKSL